MGQAIRLSALLIAALLALTSLSGMAKEQQNNGANNQPLAGLDKMLKQANGAKVDAIVDPKIATNVTNALNDMAMNLRKMLVENRRLSMQVQDLVTRVQNATGVNATNSFGNIMQQQQQATNFSSLASNFNLNNLSTLMPRFGN